MNDKLYKSILRELQVKRRHLLLEGGVAGHLMHLYDNPDLSYSDMEEILTAAAQGELVGTEKTDGYNIYLSYVDGEARYARNKGDMRKAGSNTDDLAARVFQGGEDVKRVYQASFRAFEKAVEALTPEEQSFLFGDETPIFLNTEIQGPGASNVVSYDANVLSIHGSGHKEYDAANDVVTNEDDAVVQRISQTLDSVVDRFEEATADEPFSVRKTAVMQLQALEDQTVLEDTLRRINAAGFGGDMTVGEYVNSKLTPVIKRAAPSANKALVADIIDHIKETKGRTNIRKVRKMLKDDQERIAVAELLEKDNKKKLLSGTIAPIEDAIHDFAVEMLKGLESAYILDNGKELERLRQEVATAIEQIQSYEGAGKEEAQALLIRQLKKLKSHDNVNTTVEGFVFAWGGQQYKFTGNFAPINQILGLFRYGRGDVQAIQQIGEDGSVIREQNGGRTIAVLPGAFKPPHRGHFAMVRQYAIMANEVRILVSPLTRTSKGGTDVTSEHSINLWRKYIEAYGLQDTVKVEISKFNSPVKTTFEFVANPDNESKFAQPGDKIILGVSEKGGDDERFAGNVQKHAREGVQVLAGGKYSISVDGKDFTHSVTGQPLSATDFRDNCLDNGDPRCIAEFLPKAVRSQAEEVLNMFGVQEIVPPEQAQIAETLFGIIEEVLDEITASDDVLAAMRDMEALPVTTHGRKPAKGYGEREIDYKDIMTRILKSLTDEDYDELHSVTQELESDFEYLKENPVEETMDEISAMAGGAVEGTPGSKKKKKEADTLIREDDEEIEENMADLAWGAATLKLDPVERAPYYDEEDEIEPLIKRRPGANVALGE